MSRNDELRGEMGEKSREQILRVSKVRSKEQGVGG